MVVNPIVEKDLKIKMRGWKAPVLITAYLGFLGLIIMMFFLDNMFSTYRYFNPRVMTNAFNVVAIFQFALILLITPALTASSISGERERQTLDLLLCTDFSTFKIVLGKIIVSIAHVLLLITASLPILSTVFLFGGFRITDILMLFGFYLLTALMVASMGLFFSAIFKKSSVSMIVTYISVLTLIFGTVIALGLYISIASRISNQPVTNCSMFFLFPNPLYGFGSVINVNELTSIIRSIGGRYNVSMQINPWLINGTFDIIASIIFVVLSAWKIRPVKRFRLKFRYGKTHTGKGEVEDE